MSRVGLKTYFITTSVYVFKYTGVYTLTKCLLLSYRYITTFIGVVELSSVTKALITLRIPLTNQIRGNQKWRQTIRTGKSQ